MFIFLAVAALSAVAFGLYTLRQTKNEPWWDRAVRALLPLSAVIACACAFRQILYSVFPSWGAARLAITYHFWQGYPLYYGEAEGPILGSMYSPLYFLLYLPAAWISDPTNALLLGSVMGFLMAMAPQGWLHMSSAAGNTDDRLWKIAGLTTYFLVAMNVFPITYAVFNLRGDAPALGLCAIAAGVVYKRAQLGWRDLAVISGCIALACWAKQTAAPAAIALAFYMWVTDGFRTAFRFALTMTAATIFVIAATVLWIPVRTLYFNIVEFPATNPWNYLSCFDPQAECRSAVSVVDRLATLGWMAHRYFVDYLPLAIFTVLVCGLAAVTTPASIRPWFRRNRWSVFVFVALSMFPMAVANRVKFGGEDSALSLTLYFLLAAVILGLRAVAAHGPQADATSKVILLTLLVIYLPVSVNKLGSLPRIASNLRENPQQVAFDYLKKHPGEAYFPWTPLGSIMAERQAYHYDHAVADRERSGFPVSRERFLDHIPSGFQLLAYPPEYGDYQPRKALQYLPEFTEAPAVSELPGWTIYRRAGYGSLRQTPSMDLPNR